MYWKEKLGKTTSRDQNLRNENGEIKLKDNKTKKTRKTAQK